jgi:DNA-binding protein H-NS
VAKPEWTKAAMSKDLDKLTAAELQTFMADVKQIWQKRVQKDLAELRSEIDAKLKSAGYSLEDVYAARFKHKAERRQARYADPEDGKLSWSGRGRVPGWLQARLDSGEPLDRFLIK